MTSDTPRPEIKLGHLGTCVGYYLRLAQDASFHAFAARVGDGRLRPGHFTLLMLIRENPGITQTAISHASGRDKSTLTPALRALEDGGYVARERIDHDRRSFRLTLTPAGEVAIAQLCEHARAHDAELDRIIGVERKAAFLATLRAIAEAFGDPRGKG